MPLQSTILDDSPTGDFWMERNVQIDGYSFSVDDRKLILDGPALDAPIQIVFSPLEANQLSMLLNKLVPDDFGIRSDFRVPVTVGMGLQTSIEIDERSFGVQTTSLSLSGLYAKSDNQRIGFSGDSCTVSLSLAEHSVTLPALITRSNRLGVGATFADSTTPEELSSIVMALQRKWIAEQSSE